jgi:hypothetical protein
LQAAWKFVERVSFPAFICQALVCTGTLLTFTATIAAAATWAQLVIGLIIAR